MDPDTLEILNVMASRRVQTKLYRLYSRTWEEQGRPELGGVIDPSEWGVYPWQKTFHDLGIEKNERMLMANNQSGKSRTCAAEVACHAVGFYAPWWKGLRFDKPVDLLVAGETNESTRDICMESLLGKVDEFREFEGTGWIPKDCIGPAAFRQCGVSNVLDMIKIRHASGGWSTIKFRSYQQGWTTFQGVQFNFGWLDEEPDESSGQKGIWGEVQTRMMVRDGSLVMSRTPLFGQTAIVNYFLKGGPKVAYVNATMDDCPHISAAKKEEMLSRWPEHERETRSKGVPMLGEGAVFAVSDNDIVVAPFKIPAHFRVICGIDFGIDHPAAACWLAHDADEDVIYVYDCYKKANETPVYHVAAIKARGDRIPVAWPHDGINRDKGSGRQLIELYNDHGLNSLGISARWDDEIGGGQSVERAVVEILERMRTGRWKVFQSCGGWLEEKRMLHRKDGKIVTVNDDIFSASRAALMCLRYAAHNVGRYTDRQETAEDLTDPLGAFL